METELKYRIINYPFMGTGINTERLMLMARLCYSPIGADAMADTVMGKEGTISDEEAGRFVRGLISSGHLGALELRADARPLNPNACDRLCACGLRAS